MLPTSRHVSVLLQESIQSLKCAPGKHYLDFTLGGGGHTAAILGETAPDGMVVACDRDEAALVRAKDRLHAWSSRLRLVHRNLSQADDVMRENGDLCFSGAMIDAGLSSDQLDDENRGFSFQKEAPLDMRMNPKDRVTARDLIFQMKEDELANLIFNYGEEPFSRKIAQSIVQARKQGKLETTLDLAEAVKQGVRFKRGKIHPATKTFQALRIAVNRELEELREGIQKLLGLLPEYSRLAVITFHSLEDRIVKNLFRTAKNEKIAKMVTKKPIVPGRDEILGNPRSRSAKLRVVEIEARL